MYEFVDVNERGALLRQPVDNMKVNGQYVHEMIEGYRQLYVSGRDVIGQSIHTEVVPGRAGVWVNTVADMERMITVTYRLEASTSQELRDKNAQLNRLLRGELTLVFDDEPLYEYKAWLKEASQPLEQHLVLKGSFTFLVPATYKKKQKQTSTGLITLSDAPYVLPERIVVVPNKTIDRIDIRSRDKRIVLNGSYAANEEVVIEYETDRITIQSRGGNRLSELEQFSPLEQFYLYSGETVTANVPIKEISWRDERL